MSTTTHVLLDFPRSREQWLDAQRNDPLIKALAVRMISNPKLAYEVVTGACSWPPADDEQLGELAGRAADKADDLISLALDGDFIPAFQIEQLLAAEVALVELEKIGDAEYRERQDALDDAPAFVPGRGWQGVFR